MGSYKEKQDMVKQPGSSNDGKSRPPVHLKGQGEGVMFLEPGVSCSLGQGSDGALTCSRGIRGSQLLPKPRPSRENQYQALFPPSSDRLPVPSIGHNQLKARITCLMLSIKVSFLWHRTGNRGVKMRCGKSNR